MVRLWVARVLAGVVAFAAGGAVLSAMAGVLADLAPGWQVAVSLLVAAPVMALVWTLLADGPQATAALVRVRRGRR